MSVFSWASLENCTVRNKQQKKTQNKKLVSLSKQRAGWQLRTHRPMLPLAMYLEDSNCSVNTHGIMLSGWTTRKDRHFYCAYNPVTISQSHTLRIRKKRKQTQNSGRDGQFNAPSSQYLCFGSVWSTSHSLTCFVLTTAPGVCTASCLVREKAEVHRDGILRSIFFLTFLYGLPGESYLLISKL